MSSAEAAVARDNTREIPRNRATAAEIFLLLAIAPMEKTLAGANEVDEYAIVIAGVQEVAEATPKRATALRNGSARHRAFHRK